MVVVRRISALCVFGMLAGCGLSPVGAEAPARLPPGGVVAASPFSPVSMRIYPLTHTELSARGGALLVVFIELKDQWGDTVKGAGALELRLTREGGGSDEPGDAVWSIDLSDLDRNAALYDPSTRTYRFALDGLPGWLSEIVRGGGAIPRGIWLEAYLRTVGPDGAAETLRDRMDLGR